MFSKKEQLYKILCNTETCASDITSCQGKRGNRCKKLGKSFIHYMNDAQIDYVTSPLYKNIFLKACPGSGKTEVLSIKIAYELEQWNNINEGLAILTFTNSAENELRDRVDCYLKEKLGYPHFLGTFTSWLHGYIANPFLYKLTGYEGNINADKSLRLIDGDCNSDFLDIFSSKYKYKTLGHLRANEYFRDFKKNEYQYCGYRNRDGEEILQQLMAQDNWREEDLTKTKLKFWKNGFVNYEDVECLSYLLLQKYSEIAELIAKRFPMIFIDECQDLSCIQLKILAILYKKGCKLHFVGDLNQSIYGFRNIEPKDIKEFINKYDFEIQILDENYRSCQSIVDASEYIVNSNNKIIGKKRPRVFNPLLAILYSKGMEKQAINRFYEYVSKYKLSLDESRIIVRNNSLKNKLLGIKNQKQKLNNLESFAQIIYLLNVDDQQFDFKFFFETLAKSIQSIFFKSSEHLNKQFLYQPVELENKIWKQLLLQIKNIIKAEKELNNFLLTWSQWKEVLNKTIKEKILILPELSNNTYNLGNIRKGNKDKIVRDTLFLTKTNEKLYFDIETIHGCKGMSLDAVFFLSSYQASKDEHSGGYWKQWMGREEIGEENRLAYVAFSRAQYLLALGIPKPKSFSVQDKKILENAGFIIEEC